MKRDRVAEGFVSKVAFVIIVRRCKRAYNVLYSQSLSYKAGPNFFGRYTLLFLLSPLRIGPNVISDRWAIRNVRSQIQTRGTQS